MYLYLNSASGMAENPVQIGDTGDRKCVSSSILCGAVESLIEAVILGMVISCGNDVNSGSFLAFCHFERQNFLRIVHCVEARRFFCT